MLNIFNNLKPFIEDCYQEIGVREYSRITNITPPTASKLLKEFEAQDLLKKRTERGFLLFRANRESSVLKDLSRIYWKQNLKELIEHLNLELYNPAIVLFDSLAKLEAKKDSDIDLTIFTSLKKKVNLAKYEKTLGREIQLFRFKLLSDINSKELKNNIINGYIIQGGIK